MRTLEKNAVMTRKNIRLIVKNTDAKSASSCIIINDKSSKYKSLIAACSLNSNKYENHFFNCKCKQKKMLDPINANHTK